MQHGSKKKQHMWPCGQLLFVENEHTALFRATLLLIVDPEQRKKHSFHIVMPRSIMEALSKEQREMIEDYIARPPRRGSEAVFI